MHATHDELAAWIGTSQIEVTRSLRKLREEGLVESIPRCRGITILDRDKLADYESSGS